MIDTHAHLYLPEFESDLEEVIQRAKAQGVDEIWIPGTDLASLSAMDRLRDLAPGFFRFFGGLHPEDIQEYYREKLKQIRKIVDAGYFCGIGEIGMDLYWDKTYLEQQKEAFIEQLDWALQRRLPVLIHVREAFHEVMPIVRNYYDKGLKGIFHCFAGNLEEALELTGQGFLLGVNGNITYKKSSVAPFLHQIPLESIVAETDSPYLSPIPHRGKRNESQYVSLVISKLAELYGRSFEEIEQQTTLNAKRLLD